MRHSMLSHNTNTKYMYKSKTDWLVVSIIGFPVPLINNQLSPLSSSLNYVSLNVHFDCSASGLGYQWSVRVGLGGNDNYHCNGFDNLWAILCNILLWLFTISILIFSTIIVTFMSGHHIKLQYCTFYISRPRQIPPNKRRFQYRIYWDIYYVRLTHILNINPKTRNFYFPYQQ